MSSHPSSTPAPATAPATAWVGPDVTVAQPVVYLTECSSCGGQFPSYRAICAECEDIADADGYRDGRKAV